MKRKNKFLLIFTLLSTLFPASGVFDGWGSTILHHVADSKGVALFDINGDGQKETLFITKHIIMLLISAIVTLLISLVATKKYRKKHIG